jgi:hypothetical protein
MNILIYTINDFSFKCGGLVVQYLLASILSRLGLNVRIRAPNNIKNSIFNKYYNNDINLENTIVIYGETIKGNPMNAKYVVRWILAELGIISPLEIANTWGKNDLVYYFNSEKKFIESPEKIGNIYKLLSIIYLNPYIKQTNFNTRKGICYTIRKGYEIHKNKLRLVHPKTAFEITREHGQMDYVKFFNTYEYFMCYDSNTFLVVMAALCGCIPVIYKVEGLTKKDWINTTSAAEYCKFKGIDNLYGIAYGREDMDYAKKTIHLVREQWNDIINFCKNKTVIPFINDIQNFDKMINTIQNNYF